MSVFQLSLFHFPHCNVVERQPENFLSYFVLLRRFTTREVFQRQVQVWLISIVLQEMYDAFLAKLTCLRQRKGYEAQTLFTQPFPNVREPGLCNAPFREPVFTICTEAHSAFFPRWRISDNLRWV